MAVFSYRTLQAPVGGAYKEKGSKFLAFAYPVENEQDIREKIELLKKKYFDARHHCFAYVLDPDKKKYRAFDDGEPNHSAGDPILGQVRSKDLTNILVVVVRYFGGTKLGVGGLISAYKAAAEDALNNAVIVEKDIKKSIHLEYNYSSTPEVMRLIKEFELTINDQTFGDKCSLKFEYSLARESMLLEKINLLQALGHIEKIAC
jgi:uncharacterized YigZ family protein